MGERKLVVHVTDRRELDKFECSIIPSQIASTKLVHASFMLWQQLITFSCTVQMFLMLLEKHHLQNKAFILDQTRHSENGLWHVMERRYQKVGESQYLQLCKDTPSHHACGRHCDRILVDIGFTATVHEPCLYYGHFDGDKVYFKRQVDDFAIACAEERIANVIFDAIDSKLQIPIKRQGNTNTIPQSRRTSILLVYQNLRRNIFDEDSITIFQHMVRHTIETNARSIRHQ